MVKLFAISIESYHSISLSSFSSLAGAVDPALILEQIENQILIIKDEASSRHEILERVEKWLAACDEESWLEEYNRVGHYSLN